MSEPKELTKEMFDSLKTRFANIIENMNQELIAVQKEGIQLQAKLRTHGFCSELQVMECPRCDCYKSLVWRDDELGYICVTCAVEIARAEGKAEGQM